MNRHRVQDKAEVNNRRTCECIVMGYALFVSKLKNYINDLLTLIYITLSVKKISTN